MSRIKTALFLLGCIALTGCGADGEPIQPTMNANIGISGSGAHGYGSVGLHRGPVSLHLGF